MNDKLDEKLGSEIIILPSNFIYPELNEEHDIYGANFLASPIINPSGDWRKFLPPGELQRRAGVEPSSCYVEASQHIIATIEEYALGEKDNNYASRFNALLSNGSRFGGDPLKGADSIRHDGLVREDVMPQTDINSWEEFHSWKGVNETKVRIEGKKDLAAKERNNGAFITKGLPVETKFQLLREGLKRCPVFISVWGATDGNGNYLPKPKGQGDTHAVEVTYVDENNVIWILDTYAPFEKPLPANYNFDFGMGWTVQKTSKNEEIRRLAETVNGNRNWVYDLANGFARFFLDLFPMTPLKEPALMPLKIEITPEKEVEFVPVKPDYITKWAISIRDFEGWHPGSKSFRNNNAGNIKARNGTFLKFNTANEGMEYLKDYLRRACTGKHAAYKPEFTMRQFVSVFAPDGIRIIENYTAHICKDLGITPETRIRDLV